MTYEKRILYSIKEPDKNHLWLRPRLDREGYDLLYFGSKGWTPLIDCSCTNNMMEPSDSIPGVTDNCGCTSKD